MKARVQVRHQNKWIRKLSHLANFPPKLAVLFLVLSWGLSAFFFVVFLKNSGWIPRTPTTVYDLAYLLVAFVFFVLPFVSQVKVGNIALGMTRPVEGDVSQQEAQEISRKVGAETMMELKILNTLWNRQVLRFPDLNKFWTFKLNSTSPEFLEFREAGNRLMGKTLIDETDRGQFRLTQKGLAYCAEHYKEFPEDTWFEYIPVPQEHLRKVLEKLK